MRKEDNELMYSIASEIAEVESNKVKPCQERIVEIEKDYQAIKTIMSGNDVDITIGLHEPFNSMGFITIEGLGININNTSVFADIIRNADVAEIYSKTNGNVVIDLTYHDVADIE